MTCVFSWPVRSTVDPAILIPAAARAWRRARDERSPVQQALYAALHPLRCGMLAPVLDSLLTLYETDAGRRLRVGDEHDLLRLLAREDDPAPGAALDTALRSTRIMMRVVCEPAGAADQDVPQLLPAELDRIMLSA